MLANIFQPLIDVAEAILTFFHDNVGFGWGLSIVALTVTVRLAILPLTFKQVRSMQAMQRLQPEMKKLQERYKDDRQRMNQELMKLYQEHQVNPLGSCLPLVLQLPFFLSLFYLQQSEGFRVVVRDGGAGLGDLAGSRLFDVAANPTQYTGGQKFLFIPDLTLPPEGAVLAALVVIYIVTQLGSSTVSAMAMTDKNQKRLMFALPFLFVPFIINFPAGLLVYWITTNTWTIGQQLVIRKVLPPPHLKSEDDKDAKPKDAKPAKDGKPEKSKPAKPAKVAKGTAVAAATATSGDGAKATGDGKASGNGGGGRKARKPKAAQAGGAAAKTAGKSSSGSGKNGGKAAAEADNGGSQKAPPPSPRKKKKRSGRRR